MEESISKAAGATFGEYVSPRDFRRMIRSIGRLPAERTTTYKIRHLYTENDEEPGAPARPHLNLLESGPAVLTRKALTKVTRCAPYSCPSKICVRRNSA